MAVAATLLRIRLSAFLRVVGIDNAANSGGPPKKSLSRKLR